ncbi:hypothetical protein DB88DRAFT_508852 [Papiliotrema laurentii]|uniref:Extracellular membrane protein CFEM domain-containing protein n=1 Tax=Papiliotrema laurentii TaxID=5418 RepID=A0AAD9FV20_PAPLA|nr:hypothetical protein DB88DRAFT_508852 [Papiliotrema laurentii]
MTRFTSTSPFLLVLSILPLTLGSATKQFNVNVQTEASSCWMLCHSFVTSNVPIPNVDVNSYLYIDRNCRSPAYISTMSTCLAQRCESVPDAAYGAEYGTSICHRAGVKVTLELPEAYVAAASEYFQSEGYTSRGVRGVRNWGLDWVFLLALSTVLYLAF